MLNSHGGSRIYFYCHHTEYIVSCYEIAAAAVISRKSHSLSFRHKPEGANDVDVDVHAKFRGPSISAKRCKQFECKFLKFF